jgi:hypothetical protein
MSIQTASHGPASPTQGIPVAPTVRIPRIPQQRPSRGDWPDLKSGRPSRPSRLIRHRGPRRRRVHGLLDTRVLAVATTGYVIADAAYGGPLNWLTGWAGIAFFGGLLVLASLAEALLHG